MTEPFRYPDAPHVRRHGPRGYADADGFRPWLRDEFCFRCVYCLQREVWGPVRAAYELDHLLPVRAQRLHADVDANGHETESRADAVQDDADVPGIRTRPA